MDLQKLPYLPLHFFYYQLSKPYRVAFVGGMLFLVVMVGLWLFSYENPSAYALEISEVPETYAETVTVDTLQQAYRSFPLTFQAYRQRVSYSAGPLQAPGWTWALGFMVLALAWSLVMANATMIRSRWAFLFYLLFAFWLHSTGASELILPDMTWGSKLLEFGVIIAFLGVGYAFQMNYLRGGIGLRWLIFTGLSAALFGTASFLTPAQGQVFQTMAGSAYLYLAILSLILVVFLSKEPTNLWVFLATNRPHPATRLRPAFVYLGFFLLMLLNLLWLDYYLGLNVLVQDEPGLRPSHFLFGAALLTPFLSQNHFHLVRNIFSSIGVYSLMLLLWPLMGLTFWWLQLSAFDPLHAYNIDRLAAITFTGIGVGHIIFILLNHGELLRRRINFYYLMANGPRVGFAVVWLLGITLWVFAEGFENWKSPRLFSHGYALQKADRYLSAGQVEDAQKHYRIALGLAQSSPKAHYNLASLLLANPERMGEAVEHYRQSGRSFDFPYGYLNAANLYYFNNQATAARALLQEGVGRFVEAPALWNNLGNQWVSEAQPDSAIQAYKQALQLDLDLASVYSNLAQVYWAYDRSEEAQEFFQAALQTPEPSPSALMSSLWYHLASGRSLDVDPESGAGSEDPLLIYNRHLLRLDQSDTLGRGVIQALADGGEAPDAQLLDGYLLFQEGDHERARSRLNFLAESYERYAGRAYYLIGLDYYQKGLPELAQVYFARQAEAGDPQGRLLAAQMDIDLGRVEEANAELSLLRAEWPALRTAASKEIAMLLKAYGQDLYAQLEYDLSQLSYEEKIRLGRYADSTRYFSIALGIYQDLIAADSNRVAPFLEMGRIYNRYCDTLALVNLELGLDHSPENTPLQLAYAEAQLCARRPDAAAQTLDPVSAGEGYHPWAERLRARLELQQRDTAAAITRLDTLVAQQPLAREAILQLAEIYRAKGDAYAVNQLVGHALVSNDQHPELWYYFAWSSRELGYGEDAAFGIRRAMALAFNQRQARRFRQEFTEVLAQYPGEMPAEPLTP